MTNDSQIDDPGRTFELESLPGQIVDERYEVQNLIGQGAMGAVFRAYQIRLRRTVALKVPKPQFLKNRDFVGRFEREALTLAKLVHENVVQVHDVYVSHDPAVPSFIVMEFVEGATLQDYVRREKETLTVGRLMEMLQAIARGLDAAHASGIVHRDIKPANIVVTMPAGMPKIMDFGIARVEMDDVFATQGDSIVGTPAFMAPEQIRGGQLGPAADVYAFGMMAYALLTDKLAFEARSKSDMLVAQVKDSPIPLHQRNPLLPAEAWTALAPALAKGPAERPQKASQLAAALTEALRPVAAVTLADLYERRISTAELGGSMPPTSHIGTAEKKAAMAAASAVDPSSFHSAGTHLASPSPTIPPTSMTQAPTIGTVPPATIAPPPPTPTQTGTRPGTTLMTSFPPPLAAPVVPQHRASGGMMFAVIASIIALLLTGGIAAVVFTRGGGTAPRPVASPVPTAQPTPMTHIPEQSPAPAGGPLENIVAAIAAGPPEDGFGGPPPPGAGEDGRMRIRSDRWTDDPLWNSKVTAQLPPGPERDAKIAELKAFLNDWIEAPIRNSDFSEQRNLLAFAKTRESMMLLRALTTLSSQYDKVEIELSLAPESVIWRDHAIPVATIRISGLPKGVPNPQRAMLREVTNGLRLKVVWKNGKPEAEDVAIEGLPPLGGPGGPGGGPGGGPPGGRRPFRPQP